jgi:hypothetical protein
MKTIITLANLSESTEQEVFDHVVAHARRQGKKSGYIGEESGDFLCMYRDGTGSSCFAGCLMTDQEYIDYGVEKCESDSWYTVTNEKVISSQNSDLIGKMQRIHDRCNIYSWEEHFKHLANAHSLVYISPV